MGFLFKGLGFRVYLIWGSIRSLWPSGALLVSLLGFLQGVPFRFPLKGLRDYDSRLFSGSFRVPLRVPLRSR